MVPFSAPIESPNSGSIINLLKWAVSDGPSEWCDDVTYDADKTLTQLFITANNFTVNAAKTLTLTRLRPLIVVANTITINGTITASGKGCSDGSSPAGNRYTGIGWPFGALADEEKSVTRNYCLCGAGGGTGNASGGKGGGAYGAGGNAGAAGGACNLTDAELKELLLSPSFNIFQAGFGGGGGSYTGIGGDGGGSILLIAKTIVVGSAGNILSNGVDGGDSGGDGGGGGGGGFIALLANTVSVDGGANVTANGGAKGEDTGDHSHDGGAGGNGACIQIEV